MMIKTTMMITIMPHLPLFHVIALSNYEPFYDNKMKYNYRKTSSISRTKSQNANVSCIILQLSSLNLLKPGVQLRMKM